MAVKEETQKVVLDQDDEYFNTYEDLKVHKVMLMDKARLEAYANAILGNISHFQDKIVLDVGSGSGILSMFCAQAGAKRVYAVEAAVNVAEMSKKVIKTNGLDNIIEVYVGPVEEVTLPSKVDIIVSEWMGHYLLHECMLDSVLKAKEKFLVPNGTLFPDYCSLWVAACELPDYYNYWDDIKGFDMSMFGEVLRDKVQNTVQIMKIPEESILSDPIQIFAFDLNSVNLDRLNEMKSQLVFIAKRDSNIHGICFWFDVKFPVSTEVILSTSPSDPPTHWEQTVIVFKEAIPCIKGDPFLAELTLMKDDRRRYSISVEALEDNAFSHPIPCKCNAIACLIIRKYLESRPQKEMAE